MKFNKFFQTALLSGLAVLLASCSLEDFSRHYRQLDDDIRPFSYRFKNPEIAPGDTAELSVIFSGKRKLKAEDISWRVNWNYVTNRFGSSAPVNGFEKPLKIIGDVQIADTHDGHSQTATIKFVVPDSMLYESYAIPASLQQMAEMYNFKNIPQGSFPTSKESILNMFETFAKNPQRQIPESYRKYIDGLSQIFSAMFEIYIEIPNTPRSKIRHTVRYHGKLHARWSGMDVVHINRNPVFNIYFYQGNNYFYQGNNAYCIVENNISLYRNRPLEISLNRNERAFLTFEPTARDLALSLEQALSDYPRWLRYERVYPRWFFEGGEAYSKLWFSESPQETQSLYDDGQESESLVFYRTINIDYDKVKAGDTAYLFIVLFDDVDGVIYRPQGRTTLGFSIKFVD